jgi:phage I-like protein
LVRNPRIESARLFNGVRFDGSILAEESSEGAWRLRYEALVSQRREEEADRKIDGFIREGRLTPAQAPFAKALLTAPQTVQFDGESRPIGQLFASLVERQPVSRLFHEEAPEQEVADYSQQLLLPEEAEFYRKHFPDISLDAIAQKR